MQRLKPILFFLVVGSLAGYIVWREAQNPSATVAIGADAPDFAIKDAQGKEIRLSDYRGKLVFLNFWATWCEPCVEEMPDMERMYKAFEGRQFEMIAVTVDTSWGAVDQFYDKYTLSLPKYLDPGRKAAAKYRVTGFPETFLISPEGKILKHYIGPPPEGWSNPRVWASVESLIPDQTVALE